MSHRSDLLAKFNNVRKRFWSIQPLPRSLLSFGVAIAVIVLIGLACLNATTRPFVQQNAAAALWVGDILMYVSIIFGFWQAVEQPMIVRERDSWQKIRAEINQHITEQKEGMEKNPGKTNFAAGHRAEEINTFNQRLEDAEVRLKELDQSEKFSKYTIRLSIGSATIGILIKAVLLPYTL